jgi:hypothetical protein
MTTAVTVRIVWRPNPGSAAFCAALKMKNVPDPMAACPDPMASFFVSLMTAHQRQIPLTQLVETLRPPKQRQAVVDAETDPLSFPASRPRSL